jgi:hypothetical protein
MRLRSITKHLREQNWYAVVLDFVIVVVGILIAFQITSWNEVRQKDQRAEHFLERLEHDFVQTLGATDRGLAFHKQSLQASSRLINGINTGSFDQEQLISDLDAVTEFFTPPGPSTAFQELVSSGNTNLIRNEALRNALYNYNNFVAFLRDSYMQFTTPITQVQSELMGARTLVVTGIPSEDFEQLGRTQSMNHAVLLENPNTLDLLQLNYLTHDNIHLVLYQIRTRIEEILRLIKTEKEKTQ